MIKSPPLYPIVLLCTLIIPVTGQAQEISPQPGYQGDTITIPAGSQGHGQDFNLPPKGVKQADVLAGYGEPNRRVAAVGEPPIGRWIYPGFTVYFEGDTVLHSVLVHQP